MKPPKRLKAGGKVFKPALNDASSAPRGDLHASAVGDKITSIRPLFRWAWQAAHGQVASMQVRLLVLRQNCSRDDLLRGASSRRASPAQARIRQAEAAALLAMIQVQSLMPGANARRHLLGFTAVQQARCGLWPDQAQ